MLDIRQTQLAVQWQQIWSKYPPVAEKLREAYQHLWVRFHSLPSSKRYPETEVENAIVLDRYNTLLDELVGDDDVYLITSQWTTSPQSSQTRASTYWLTIDEAPEETDPEYKSFRHISIERKPWRRGIFDELFRSVANDESAGVIVAAKDFTWLFCPYDGGVDMFLPENERDRYKLKYKDWLSTEKSGL